MSQATDNYKTEHISQDYYKYLVDLRRKCNQLHTSLRFEPDSEKQRKFKQYMTLLIKEMKPKYDRRKDMDKPEELEEDIKTLSVDELDGLLEDISLLQERLGITSMARRQYELKAKGAVDKENDESNVNGKGAVKKNE